ncbi:alkaline phosphatase family protein [Myxococcota bacterium]|nr:alkaline phosphatase family protein [Myxococcota bacterium]
MKHHATLGGALLGAVLGALPGTAFAFQAERLNPWFVDEPGSYFLVAVLPLMLPGTLLGALIGRRADRAGRHPGRALTLKIAVPLALAWIFGILSTFTAPQPARVDSKLVIVGVDGASWDLVDKLQLPVFQTLQREGTRAVLLSREPMFSPLLWATMATGQVPEVHGIHGFRVRGDQTAYARWWDVAHQEGLRIGLYKWLVTFPPQDLSQPAPAAAARAPARADGAFYQEAREKGRAGFVVPAWLAPTPETWPADLSFVKEIELSRRLKRTQYAGARPGWKLALAGIPKGFRWSTLREAARWTLVERFGKPRPEERAWRLQLLRVAMDRDVFIHQLHMHRPDVASFTLYSTDALGHTHFGFMDECEKGTRPCDDLAAALPAAYRQADQVLYEIANSVEDETTILVVSDHGFRVMGEEDAGRYFAPKTERLKARIEAEVGPVDVSKAGHKLTVAVLGQDVEAEKARLVTFLGGLTQQSTGQPFYRWEELPDSPRALGLTLTDERIDQARLDTDRVGGEPLSDYATLTDAYSGEHDVAGILLARGPAIPAGAVHEPVALLDLTPTILALLDLPAAIDMPGKAVFGETLPRVATWEPLAPIHHGGSAATGEADVNTEALKALGYIEE